jgi:hypothetical protein
LGRGDGGGGKGGGTGGGGGLTPFGITDLDPAAVDASADRAATIDATRARAGEIARAAADSYRNGELERAAGLLRSAARFVDDAARATGAPELVAASRNIAELEALGANEGCAYAAKAASEAGRDFAR